MSEKSGANPMCTSKVVEEGEHGMEVMLGMEDAWENKDESFFIGGPPNFMQQFPRGPWELVWKLMLS